MKIFINDTKEVPNIGSVIERLRKDSTCSLEISVNDSEASPDDLGAMFEDITDIKVVRTDLNGIEKTVVYTKYTQIEKIQRRIVDETDITTVSLVRAVQAETEDGD